MRQDRLREPEPSQGARRCGRVERHEGLDLLIDGLAVARITRLITTDNIFDRPRAWLLNTLTVHGHDTAVEGLLCDWCTGVWVAAAVTVARHAAPRTWSKVAPFLAAAQIAGSLLSAEH